MLFSNSLHFLPTIDAVLEISKASRKRSNKFKYNFLEAEVPQLQ